MIYTITAYPACSFALAQRQGIPDGRTFGYLTSLDAAMEAVITDAADMHECLYTHLVIEEVPEGIHALATAVQWFDWEDGKGWIMQAETPAWARGLINHSMG